MKSLPFSLSALCLLIFFTACEKNPDVPVNKAPVANAGSSQIIQLPLDSASLNGLGTDSDGEVIGYIWSELSGPNAAVIVNDAAATTIVKELKAGVYVFQLAVVDNDGAIGIDTVSFTVNAVVVHTLFLQPADNPTEVHVYGNNGSIEGSYPPAAEIGAASWTDGGEQVGMRGLLKFDLSSIPSNSNILSAKLTLYSNPNASNGDHINPNSGLNNTTLIGQVISPWVANTVRWTNQPATTSNNQITIPHTLEGSLDLININVSNLVSAMILVNSNNGFFIRLQTETPYNSRIFCSSKYPEAAKHPKLVIEYSGN